LTIPRVQPAHLRHLKIAVGGLKVQPVRQLKIVLGQDAFGAKQLKENNY